MSILEDTFSLSKNGGIYFSGARVPVQDDVLVLLIGLGGMGAKTLLQLKNQVMNRMALPLNDNNRPLGIPPKNIAFLAFDTSSKSLSDHYSSTTLDANTEVSNVSPGATTTWNDMVKRIETNKRNGLKYAQFLPDNVGNCGTDEEAGARRLMGKVAFIHHAPTIRKKIKATLDRMKQEVPGYKKIYVFVFAGISGGTGSGMFLDMGYLLKTMTAGQVAQVMGYFFLDDLNDKDPGSTDGRSANAFAALKELDSHFERKNIPGANVQTYNYGPNGNDAMNAIYPYDYCHILNRTTTNNSVQIKKDVIKSVAESVFTYIANEQGVGDVAVTGMTNFYANISAYLLNNDDNVSYPASYNYISPNSVSVRIPYMEISTLIAGRMFESLDRTVFANHVTAQSFDEDMKSLGLGSRKNFEDSLSSLLENHDTHIKKINFDDFKDYTSSIRSGDAWENTYDEVDRYNSAMVSCFGSMVGNETNAGTLEGNLKQFIRKAIVDPKRGPFYLKEVINGTGDGVSSLNLIGLLNQQQKNFQQKSEDHRIAADNAKTQCENIYGEDELKWFNFIKKRKYVKRYKQFLKKWYNEKRDQYKYDHLSNVCERMVKVYSKYYDNIIVPITKLLSEMTVIFEQNVSYLTVQNNEYQTNPDPSLLITPIGFEHTYSNDFNKCVINAKDGFLKMLSETMKDWIRTDIDNLLPDISYHTDIQGRMSEFISKCFETLFRGITMESIMNTKLTDGTDIVAYSTGVINNMIKRVAPLFKQNTIEAPTQDFMILSVPSDCPNIKSAADAFADDDSFIIKSSDEKNCLSMVKVTAGFALLNNGYIKDMEVNYNRKINSLGSQFMHTNQKWRDLPSPYVETAWQDGYSSPITQKRNSKYRDMFIRCYKNDLITFENNGDKKAYLKISNDDAHIEDIDIDIEVDNIMNYIESLINNIKAEIWNENCPSVEMCGMGLYIMEDNPFTELGLSQENANTLGNIMTNVIRNPEICSFLEKECKHLDLIEKLHHYCTDSLMYIKAWMCGMIYVEQFSEDVRIQTNKLMPNPPTLLNKVKDLVNKDDLNYHYRIYERLCAILEENVVNTQTKWMNVIEDNYSRYCQGIKNEESQKEKEDKLNALKENFGKLYADYKTQYLSEYNDLKRKELKGIAMIYALCRNAAEKLS